ncbi:MAG TPA: L-threonylcarbamoyladenylate synthase [Spirochaetia bacterium]|nr:L-threonylcarbamoyladenylate synthase [Spirochaetia bacterium]
MVLPAADPEAFPLLVRTLSGGGIAIIPCDTIYGIVGIAPSTEQAIRAVKGRGDDKPFLQLIAEASWVGRLSAVEAPLSLSRHWPGPLTIVLPARAGGTVALRVPDSPFLRRLLAELDRPLYSTSVNRSGEAPVNTMDEIRRGFEKDVDLVLDGGPLSGRPSTLVDASVRPCRVLRQGALVLPGEDLL